MAKEVELKKIELRVSANCCEGCKRKVKKALRNVEGVLKTEIDPSQPKMIVLGNVNPQILIKKLLKIGKHAELSSYEELKGEKKEAETAAVTKEKEKEKEKNGSKQEKQQPDSIDNKADKSQDNKETNMAANAPSNLKKGDPPLPPHPEVDFTTHPNIDFRVHPMIMNPQYCYIAQPQPQPQPQPCAVAVPCYAIPSYPAPHLFPTCVEEYYHYDKSSYHYQPPLLRPTERIGDYFSDENTVGCHVM